MHNFHGLTAWVPVLREPGSQCHAVACTSYTYCLCFWLCYHEYNCRLPAWRIPACREREFLGWVSGAVSAGGKVLIPTFAMGRAQVRASKLAYCLLLCNFYTCLHLHLVLHTVCGLADPEKPHPQCVGTRVDHIQTDLCNLLAPRLQYNVSNAAHAC